MSKAGICCSDPGECVIMCKGDSDREGEVPVSSDAIHRTLPSIYAAHWLVKPAGQNHSPTRCAWNASFKTAKVSGMLLSFPPVQVV